MGQGSSKYEKSDLEEEHSNLWSSLGLSPAKREDKRKDKISESQSFKTKRLTDIEEITISATTTISNPNLSTSRVTTTPTEQIQSQSSPASTVTKNRSVTNEQMYTSAYPVPLPLMSKPPALLGDYPPGLGQGYQNLLNLKNIEATSAMSKSKAMTQNGYSHSVKVKGQGKGTKTKPVFVYDHHGKLISGNHLGPEFRQTTGILAIDCEMVGVGTLCDSVLARVSVVNRYGFCLYDTFVKPNVPVTDYRTAKSGVREEDLVNAPPHVKVVHQVSAMLKGKIVIGHSVHNDFEALQLTHPSGMTRDTAIYYQSLERTKGKPSLQKLSKDYLQFAIQSGEHSSIVDAQVTMLLYLREEINWESRLNVSGGGGVGISPKPGLRSIALMTIFPRKGDLNTGNQLVRSIQVDSPYTNQEDYLDTMFRLLREDFMKPLRQGIREYQRWITSRQKKLLPTTVRVYEGVHFRGLPGSLEMKNFQVVTIPVKQEKFDLSSTSEDSRFLINGSMLLFYPNSNGTRGDLAVKVAIVSRCTEEDDQRLRQGTLRVWFVPDGPSWKVTETTVFTVLESVAFFEAYRYALESLQGLDMSNWPLGKYILDPTIPFKSIRNDSKSFDFSNQIVQAGSGPRKSENWEDWQFGGFPSAYQLGLSKGQYEAYHSAITKELAIIQGPPGTGKTFIALKVIKFFLHNLFLLQGNPILIVSNTNHSLDNLLEMVILYAREMTGSQIVGDDMILRLGGRSKSELVEAVTLFKKKDMYDHKVHTDTKLARTREKLQAIKALSSLNLNSAEDSVRLIKVLKKAQGYLQRPAPKEPKPGIIHLPPADDRDSKLEICIYEAISNLINVSKSEGFPYVKLTFGRLQNTAALPLLLNSITAKLESLQKEFEELKHCKNESQCIRSAKIIGATVCGSVKNQKLLNKVKPVMIIVEEAAHVVESTVVAGLTEFCKRLVLIGDHKQLRPSTADHELTTANHLDVSLMERFVNNAQAKGLKTWSQLDIQRRMRPEISRLIHPTIYEVLHDDPCVTKYPNVKGMDKNLFFVDHGYHDAKAEDSTSFVNLKEADFVVNLCLYLIGQGNKPEKITIISTYLGQKFEIEKKMKQSNYYFGNSIRVCCVDGFQGEENDIILLSLVRSNDQRNIGFLKTNNRVCVALSRARHGLYIIGNMTGLSARSETWAEINKTLISGNNIGPKLRLKCALHGGQMTSVGIGGSHKPLEMTQRGTVRKCLCEMKPKRGQGQGKTATPPPKPQPLLQNPPPLMGCKQMDFKNGASKLLVPAKAVPTYTSSAQTRAVAPFPGVNRTALICAAQLNFNGIASKNAKSVPASIPNPGAAIPSLMSEFSSLQIKDWPGSASGILSCSMEPQPPIRALKNGASKLNIHEKASAPNERKPGCGKNFSCGHSCKAEATACKSKHNNYNCMENCKRICNGGHKCPVNHACYLPCHNLINCKRQVSVTCFSCRGNIIGDCSVLLPYYGKASKKYGAPKKTHCNLCQKNKM